LALNFHSRGFRVFATARNPDSISSLAALGITTLALEVHKVESVKALRDQVLSLTGGRLDYLVNNAGTNYTVPALDIDNEEVHDLFEANVFGVMRMCQTFIPLLIEAKGTIVQIGSLTGHMPYIFSSGYNASKAALHAYTNTLRNVGILLRLWSAKSLTMYTGNLTIWRQRGACRSRRREKQSISRTSPIAFVFTLQTRPSGI